MAKSTTRNFLSGHPGEQTPEKNSASFTTPKRRPHRKARTGCLTCKTRHVKCDETRPYCKRCTASGRTCSGYREPQVRPLAAPPCLQPATSKFALCGDEIDVGSKDPIGVSLTRPIDVLQLSEHAERRYLEMFYRHTFSSIYKSEADSRLVWKSLVYQLVTAEPAVRQSAIALAAAHERLGIMATGVHENPSQRALTHYNKAISHLLENQHCESGLRSNRIPLLVICLLFVATDMFLGRDGPSRLHIQSGIRLLKETMLEDRADEVKNMLWLRFDALDSHASIYPGWGSSRYYSCFNERARRTLGPERPLLTCFEDAATCYYDIVDTIHQYINIFATDPLPVEAELQKTQQDLLNGISWWKFHFKKLRSLQPSRIVGRQGFIAEILETAMEVHTLVLKGAFDSSQTVYDGLIEEMRGLVPRLTTIVRQRDQNWPDFAVETVSNEHVCIWYLFVICRDPSLRRELMDLMTRAKGRRGLWCTKSSLLAMRRIIEIEEGGLVAPKEASDIPSSNRLTQIKMDGSGPRCNVRIQYRMVPDKMRITVEEIKHRRTIWNHS